MTFFPCLQLRTSPKLTPAFAIVKRRGHKTINFEMLVAAPELGCSAAARRCPHRVTVLLAGAVGMRGEAGRVFMVWGGDWEV